MKKKLFSFSLALLLLIFSQTTLAQKLLYDAAGSENNFAKIGGTANYSLTLGGNDVVDGTVNMTQGTSAVNIALTPEILINSGEGMSVVILVSDVNVSSGGQFISLRSSANAGQGGIKLKTGSGDGTMHTTWQEGEWTGALTSSFPSDNSLNVISYLYKRTNFEGNGSTFYLNNSEIGKFTALQSTASVGNIAIGGLSSSNSTFLNTGMKIHRIQIYEGQLTTSQLQKAIDYIKLQVAYSPLTVEINSAKTLLSSTSSGINPGQYSLATRSSLQTAIDRAQAVADNNPDDDATNTAIDALKEAQVAYYSQANKLIISDNDNQVWYFLKGTRGSTASALYAQDMGANTQILNKEKAISNEQLWKITAHSSNNGYAIVNKAGRFVNANNTGNTSAVETEPTIAFNLKKNGTISDGTNIFLIENYGSPLSYRLHNGGANNGFGLMNWTGNASDNCSFTLLTYDPTDVLTELSYAADALCNSAIEGNNPGEYALSTKAIFRQAINEAIEFNNSGATSEEKAEYAANVLEVAKNNFIASSNKIIISDDNKSTWYYITGIISYAADKAIYANGTAEGSNYNFGNISLNSTMLFKFMDAGEGLYYIQNMNSGLYIGANATATSTPSPFMVNYLGEDAQFTLNMQGENPIHAQQANSKLVTWSGGLNSGSAWRLQQLSDEDANKQMSISSVGVSQGFVVTGIGNNDHPLMYANVNVEGIVGTIDIKSMNLDFSQTTKLSTIDKVKIYSIPSSDTRLKLANAKLLGEAIIDAQQIKVDFDSMFTLSNGGNKLAIAVDIANDSIEGELIKAKVVDITLADDSKKTVNSSPAHPCRIFLTQSLIIAPGDYGSVSYRIPAIAVADDGALVVVTDKRKNHSGDLAADIDLTVQRSTDNGKTWSEPIIIAGENTTTGFGDAAIVKERETGKLIVVCVSGPGFYGSTPSAPIKLIYFESLDNGFTWTAPKDITSQVWGSECSNSITKNWNGMFPASGRMLQLRDGRIMSAMLVRNPVTGTNDNFVMYSDDKGLTWQASTSMSVKGGDEAKLTQRNDGKVIISSRQGGGRVWNVSNDNGGINWTQSNQVKRPELLDQNCNGELMTYTSTLDGFNRNRMLHSLCYNTGSRQNVSMLISYNEGTTWVKRKSICPTSSAYSTFDILPDGTIGMYYEDGTHGGEAFEMVFVRFSLDWLTDGDDTYIQPIPESIVDNTIDSKVEVSVINGKIIISGSNEPFKISGINGMEFNANSVLPSGFYIVKIGGKTYKVAVK